MPQIRFAKMSGAGNDFIVFDNRDQSLPEQRSEFVHDICQRRLGIGADGVLILEQSDAADFKMRYYNADGGEAEMCGNGGRCISRYAYLKGLAGKRMAFETIAGIHRSEIVGERVRLKLVDPSHIRLNLPVKVDGDTLTVHFVNTGVPHAIQWVDDVERVDVGGLGPRIRYHPAFGPAGANANFAQVTGPHSVRIRTYERGVEDETLACGTGVVASAVVGALLGILEPPVEALTRSGLTLTVHFRLNGQHAAEVFLEGDAVVVFEGTLDASW